MACRCSLQPYLELCRVSNLPTVWTNVLAGVVLSEVPFCWPRYGILALSFSLFYSGGMSLNDLCDAKADEKAKPLRPIPSGRVSMRDARIVTMMLLGIGWVLFFLLPYPKVVWLASWLVAIIFLYDWIHKRHPLSVLLMGACRGMVLVVSGMGVAGRLMPWVGLAAICHFFYALILTLVSRYEARAERRASFSLVPWMLSAISLLDGILMSVFASPAWIFAGLAGAGLTHLGQKWVRGD